jgi:hypothetical protein
VEGFGRVFGVGAQDVVDHDDAGSRGVISVVAMQEGVPRSMRAEELR